MPVERSQHRFVLEALVKERGWTRGAEVGVKRGETFGHLLGSCPDLHMIVVDQWLRLEDTGEPGLETYRRLDMAEVENVARDVAARHPDRCQIIKGCSWEVAWHVADHSLDFVFIDASHTERAVRLDVAAWRPKVRAGGWLTGHDWDRPEVRKVLDDMLPGWQRHESDVWSLPC
jgi:hypothetical protein